MTSARNILAHLEAAAPMEDLEELLTAVSDALLQYAALTKAREPYATVSIQRHEQAAATVADLFTRLSDDAEADQ